MFKRISALIFLIVLNICAKNYWSWDCESAVNPGINRLVSNNTSIVSSQKHLGNSCMQINVSAIGGNVPAGADVKSIDLGPINNGQWFYYRWWMKLDSNFRWGNGTAYTKAGRMKLTAELMSPRVWTGYVAHDGVFLDESDAIPPNWDPNAVYIKYDFQAVAGKGWHEYIVASKMQSSDSAKDGELHLYVDGKLIGSKINFHYLKYSGDCSDAWRGWMVYPYFQLNGTSSDGGLMWLDDYSMDDQWNSIFMQGDKPVITSNDSFNITAGQQFTFQINAINNPKTFNAVSLPAGISIDSSGLIKGTANTVGTFSTTITASNSYGSSDPFVLKIIVDSAKIVAVEKPVIMYVEAYDNNNAVHIFRDDFETNDNIVNRYTQYKGSDRFYRCDSIGFGSESSKHSMVANFSAGEQDAGTLILSFGKNPIGSKVKQTINYNDIYWRFYILMEDRWIGNPNKLTRATILTSTSWQQAMAAHLWGSTTDSVINADPSTGVDASGMVITKSYNDAANLKWLGKQYGKTPIFNSKNNNTWICVEGHVALNTPGQKNGIFEFWIDGNLETRMDNLNWVGSWDSCGINTIMFENYWNGGAPRNQKLYRDNIVISTQKIGLAKSPAQPAIVLARSEQNYGIDAQVSTARSEDSLVWQSTSRPNNTKVIKVTPLNGKFMGSQQNNNSLANGNYFARVRYSLNSSQNSEWSAWKPFVVATAITPAVKAKYVEKQSTFDYYFNHSTKRLVLFGLTGETTDYIINLFTLNGTFINKLKPINSSNKLLINDISLEMPKVAKGSYILTCKSLKKNENIICGLLNLN
jgi:hypothetical protein